MTMSCGVLLTMAELHLPMESCFSLDPLVYYLSLFFVTINMGAVAGCVNVVHDGKTCKYVEWQEAKPHHSEFKKKAWCLAKTFTSDSQVAQQHRLNYNMVMFMLVLVTDLQQVAQQNFLA